MVWCFRGVSGFLEFRAGYERECDGNCDYCGMNSFCLGCYNRIGIIGLGIYAMGNFGRMWQAMYYTRACNF